MRLECVLGGWLFGMDEALVLARRLGEEPVCTDEAMLDIFIRA